MKIPTRFVTHPRLLCAILLAPFVVATAVAQGPTVYPNELYRGENVITVKYAPGIERVTIGSTRYITADASTGFLSDCPDSVDISAIVASVTSGESLDLTIYGCDGRQFTPPTLRTENWTILHEYSGEVPLTTDTCLSCRIQSPGGRWLDTITVSHPNLSVTFNSIRTDEGYRVNGGRPFNYKVCFTPTEIGTGTDTIKIRLLRNQPNRGHTTQVIAKPITWSAIPAEETAPPEAIIPAVPPLLDPTPFRNIVLPSANGLDEGEWFYGNYMVVGHLVGYGVTDRLTLLGGGSFVPDFIARLYLGSIGARYEVVREGEFSAAVGLQVALSSVTDSDIRTIAPYALASYGNVHHRVTLGLGYGLKRHTIPTESFDRNALVFAAGFNTEIDRGWKIAAEIATIESSGIAPLLVTGRHFGEDWAIDFGLGFDLAADNVLFFNDAVSGEIVELSILPFVSGMWTF